VAANLAVNYFLGNKRDTSKNELPATWPTPLGEKIAGPLAGNLAVNYFLRNKGVTSRT